MADPREPTGSVGRQPASPRWSLIVPMYQEASRIEGTIAALSQSRLNSADVEFVLVDDGSDDDTAQVARAACARHGLSAAVIQLPANRGKGAAVRAGVLASHGGVVVFTDADLSSGIEAIKQSIELIESGRSDVVLASRAAPGSLLAVRQPRPRELAGKAFNLVLRALRLTVWRDTQCGLKAFTRDAARLLFEALTIEGFAFDVELLYLARRLRLRIAELPIEWHHVEESRVRPLRDGAAMLRDALRIRLRALMRAPRIPGTAMREETYEAMARLEREHWWFRAKRELALEHLQQAGVGAGAAVDVGCGTGEMARTMSSLDLRTVIGIDPSPTAISLARRNDSALTLVVASGTALPLREASHHCLVSLDVLEHIDDDRSALEEFARVLVPGSPLLLTVPAYQWAWSDHDTVLGHRRRYSVRALRERCAAAGLTVEKCFYFHCWLVPLAFLVRKTPLRLFFRGSAEQMSYTHPLVNATLYAFTRGERLLSRLIRPPFGLSIMLLARVPPQTLALGLEEETAPVEQAARAAG